MSATKRLFEEQQQFVTDDTYGQFLQMQKEHNEQELLLDPKLQAEINSLPILTQLENIVKIIAFEAEHFCKDENKGQLEWIMWRLTNIFYSARYTNEGYDDSILYFLESFKWAENLSDEQIDKIQLATC